MLQSCALVIPIVDKIAQRREEASVARCHRRSCLDLRVLNTRRVMIDGKKYEKLLGGSTSKCVKAGETCVTSVLPLQVKHLD